MLLEEDYSEFPPEVLTLLEEFLREEKSDSDGRNVSWSDLFLPEKEQSVIVKPKRRKSKKKPSNNPAYMPALRILRKDIRRSYGAMLINVINSHDSELIRDFLMDFGIAQVSVIDINPFESDTVAFHQRLGNIIGIDAITLYFAINFLLMPDGVFQMNDVKVCKRLNTPGSRIVGNLFLRGTLLHEIPRHLDPVHYSMTQQQQQQESSSDEAEPMVFAPPLQLNLLPVPYEIYLDATITMHLDDNHRIVSITSLVNGLKEVSLEC